MAGVTGSNPVALIVCLWIVMLVMLVVLVVLVMLVVLPFSLNHQRS